MPIKNNDDNINSNHTSTDTEEEKHDKNKLSKDTEKRAFPPASRASISGTTTPATAQPPAAKTAPQPATPTHPQKPPSTPSTSTAALPLSGMQPTVQAPLTLQNNDASVAANPKDGAISPNQISADLPALLDTIQKKLAQQSNNENVQNPSSYITPQATLSTHKAAPLSLQKTASTNLVVRANNISAMPRHSILPDPAIKLDLAFTDLLNDIQKRLTKILLTQVSSIPSNPTVSPINIEITSNKLELTKPFNFMIQKNTSNIELSLPENPNQAEIALQATLEGLKAAGKKHITIDADEQTIMSTTKMALAKGMEIRFSNESEAVLKKMGYNNPKAFTQNLVEPPSNTTPKPK